MPLDSLTPPATLPDGLTIPAEPCPVYLSRALRDRSLWPAGFGPWDYEYGVGERCGCGLAAALWGEEFIFVMDNLAPALGLTYEAAACAFFDAGCALGIPDEDVTPEHVADALDAAVAARVSA